MGYQSHVKRHTRIQLFLSHYFFLFCIFFASNEERKTVVVSVGCCFHFQSGKCAQVLSFFTLWTMRPKGDQILTEIHLNANETGNMKTEEKKIIVDWNNHHCDVGSFSFMCFCSVSDTVFSSFPFEVNWFSKWCASVHSFFFLPNVNLN